MGEAILARISSITGKKITRGYGLDTIYDSTNECYWPAMEQGSSVAGKFRKDKTYCILLVTDSGSGATYLYFVVIVNGEEVYCNTTMMDYTREVGSDLALTSQDAMVFVLE